jgi:hypothetical protein
MPPAAAKKNGKPGAADKPGAGDQPEEVEDEGKDQGPKAPAPIPPPKPQPPKFMYPEGTQLLPDIPCVFLNDRSTWIEFKKGLNECALTWNLPDWMTTIVYKGTEWDTIQSQHGTDLATYFPAVEKTGAGDGLSSKTSTLGLKLVALLDRPKNLADLRPNVQYCCLSTVEFSYPE